jgi:hypothetical protein
MTKPHTKHSRGTLPAFAPVPRLCDRSNGWKPEVQRAFIEALAETGSVKAACRRVGRADHGVYQLRRHPEAHEFRQAWEAALAIGIQRIEDVAMDRALNGVEVPVYAYGKIIGTRTVYNDALLMFMLRNRASKRFAADGARGLNAVDQATLRRMRKQWRKEWEQERFAADVKREDAGAAAFIAKIKAMHRSWYCNMSPATRAAYREFRRLEDADRTSGWMAQPGAERVEVAQAEYEQWFAPGRDRRAPVSKLVDMRAWEEMEGGASDTDNPPPSPPA